MGLPWWAVVRNLPANAGEEGSIPGSGRSSGEHSNPLQYSCLENLWQKELVSYSPWGHKESDMTQQLNNNKESYRVAIKLMALFWKVLSPSPWLGDWLVYKVKSLDKVWEQETEKGGFIYLLIAWKCYLLSDLGQALQILLPWGKCFFSLKGILITLVLGRMNMYIVWLKVQSVVPNWTTQPLWRDLTWAMGFPNWKWRIIF